MCLKRYLVLGSFRISFFSFSFFKKGTVPRYMMSTKNSHGFPMACWKDWRLAVSSGGTSDSSRTGGAPGGLLLADAVALGA